MAVPTIRPFSETCRLPFKMRSTYGEMSPTLPSCFARTSIMPIVSFQFGHRPLACLKVTRADSISTHPVRACSQGLTQDHRRGISQANNRPTATPAARHTKNAVTTASPRPLYTPPPQFTVLKFLFTGSYSFSENTSRHSSIARHTKESSTMTRY